MSLWLWVILLMASIMQKKARSKASYNNPAITPREINEGQELEICGNVIALEYPSTWDYPMWYVHLHESFGSYDRWEVMPVVRSFSEVMGKSPIGKHCPSVYFLLLSAVKDRTSIGNQPVEFAGLIKLADGSYGANGLAPNKHEGKISRRCETM